MTAEYQMTKDIISTQTMVETLGNYKKERYLTH